VRHLALTLPLRSARLPRACKWTAQVALLATETSASGPSFQNVGEDLFQNNLSKIAGKHTLKMGYELLRTRYNTTTSALPGGTYNFGDAVHGRNPGP